MFGNDIQYKLEQMVIYYIPLLHYCPLRTFSIRRITYFGKAYFKTRMDLFKFISDLDLQF